MVVSRVIPVRNVSYRVENAVSPATEGKLKSANLMGSRHGEGRLHLGPNRPLRNVNPLSAKLNLK